MRSQGHPDSALSYFAQALPIARAAGDREGAAAPLVGTGMVNLDVGRPDSALAYYAQALPILRAVGNRAFEATTLEYESEADRLPVEHEKRHREIVEQLVGRGILKPDEAGNVRVERVRPNTTGNTTNPQTPADPTKVGSGN